MAKTTVMTKARTHRGMAYPAKPTEYEVEVSKIGITVAIYKNGKFTRSFIVGDEAEYDSYNLRYTGTITKITEKCVTIVAYPNSSMAKAHRLDMNTFCWRNWDFDAEKTAAYNQNESMYI
jgi:hypothetical protein